MAWREDRVKFWAAIRSGVMTEDAAAAAGVSSSVGFRWFRHAGGVNLALPPAVSGRYLSFSEREDIALFRAQGAGVREIAREPAGRRPRSCWPMIGFKSTSSNGSRARSGQRTACPISTGLAFDSYAPTMSLVSVLADGVLSKIGGPARGRNSGISRAYRRPAEVE